MKTFIRDIMKGPDAFSVREVLSKGWESTKKHWVKMIVLVILNFGLYMLQFMLLGVLASVSTVLTVVVSLAIFLAQMWASVVTLRLAVWAARGKDFLMSQLFAIKLSTVLSYLATGILLALMTMAGFLLFLLPGIYIILVYGMSMLLVADKEMGPIEALKASKTMSKPHVFNLFLYVCASYGIVYLVLSPLYYLLIIGIFVSGALATTLDPIMAGTVLAIPGMILLLAAIILYFVYIMIFWFGIGHIYHKISHAR